MSFFKLEKSKYLSQLHGPIGYNVGFMIGLLILNICLFYLMNSMSWEDIVKEQTAYHDLVHEMSFRKQIYHLQISKSNYNPTMTQFNFEEIVPTQGIVQSDVGHRDILQQISSHQFMRSSHQDFNSEQQQLINQYVQEKDDEFERLLHDEQEEYSGENRQVRFMAHGNDMAGFGVTPRNSNPVFSSTKPGFNNNVPNHKRSLTGQAVINAPPGPPPGSMAALSSDR